MVSPFAAEIHRLNEHLWKMTYGENALIASVPLRLHSADVDAGGSPEMHPRFWAYLGDAGVCLCEPREVDGYMVMRHWCDRRFKDRPAGFREPQRAVHPRRLKRALRQLRLHSPLEHAIVYLTVARGMALQPAFAHVNGIRAARGEDDLSMEDFMVLMIAGASFLSDAW